MQTLRFLSANGEEITGNLPRNATVDTACALLKRQLGPRCSELRIVNTMTTRDSRFLSAEAPRFPRPAFFQVISKSPAPPEFKPAPRFSRLLAFSRHAFREAYSEYAKLQGRVPPDFGARLDHLAQLGYPRDLCSELLFLVHFELGNAEQLLVDPPLRIEVEKAFIEGRPIPVELVARGRGVARPGIPRGLPPPAMAWPGMPHAMARPGMAPPGGMAPDRQPERAMGGRRLEDPRLQRERELRRRLRDNLDIGDDEFASLYQQAGGNLDQIAQFFRL
jgi:hypothetical protein